MQKSEPEHPKNKRKQRIFTGVVMTAIALIPTIYTTFFLGSMWDPYGSVDSLPVAVVNQDEAVQYNGKTLAVGDELVKNMQESAQLDFHFVSDETAQKGLEEGTYYMVITIPTDFSENASTLLDDTPKKMQLQYETNPGTNYIASKMSESAIAKIEKQISESVIEEYTETIFAQLDTIGSGMTDAADGASELEDGVTQLSDGNQTITDNLELLSNSTLTFVEGADALESGLNSYTAGVSEVHEGASALADGMDQLADGAGTLANGAQALSDGTNALYEGVSSYTNGVSSAYSGAQTLSGNSSDLLNGAAALSSGASQLQKGSQAMSTGLQTLSTSLSTSLSDENKATISQVTSGLTQLQQGIDTLNTTLKNTTLPDTSALTQTLTTSLTQIGTCAQDAGAQLAAIQASLTAMTETDAFQSLDPAAQMELLNCFSAPLESLAADVTEIGTQVTSISSALGSMDLSSSSSAITQLQSSVSTLATSADQLLPGAQQVIGNLSGGLQSVQSAVDEQLLPGANSLKSGIGTLVSGSTSLESGIAAYTDGVSALTSGLATLNENTSSLMGGAYSLSDGVATLTGSLPTLTDAVSQLQSGASQLNDGTAQLTANNDVLADGASQLTSGAKQIQSGAKELADGSGELGDGLTTLGSGVGTLQTALFDGADEINSLDITDATYEMFSSPVEAQERFQTEVPNNGSAMAAYMMAVGLWVAGLALCVIISPHDQKIIGKNAGQAWGIQLAKIWLLAIVQAVLMVFFLSLINGFEPEYMLRTLVIACLSSIAFLTLEYCVNFFLGVVGSFLLLVFMVLQLSGCAGTYPLELSDRFYQILNPFMPFTYAVHGFRSGIASGTDITVDCVVLAVIALVFAGILLVGSHLRMRKQAEEPDDMDTQTSVSVSAGKLIATDS